jgi:hypothetical protein
VEEVPVRPGRGVEGAGAGICFWHW